MFVPVLTSEAGLCLTARNWQEVGITTVSYALDALLLKPGLDALNQLSNLTSYLGWSGALILNASAFEMNKKGCYTIKSPFDGSKISLTPEALVALIHHLKPNAVILPKHIIHNFPEIWTQWDEAIKPFVHVNDLQTWQAQGFHGVYFTDDTLELVSKCQLMPRYVIADRSLDLLLDLKTQGVEWIESNHPALLAMQGSVYSQLGVCDLTESNAAMDFEVIDTGCKCPTCSQQLTKAYLHHLFQHTPLLCYRFLIQHNVFFASHRHLSP